MAETLEFTTATRRKKPFTFVLDGEKYTFTPPKTGGMVLDMLTAPDNEMMQGRALVDWFEAGVGPEQAAKIEARLRDPEDGFDFDTDLVPMVKELMAKVTGRPTM